MHRCHCLSPSFSILMLLATASRNAPDLESLQDLRPLFGDRGDLTMAAHQTPESKYSSNSSIGCCNGVNYSFDYTFICCSRVDPDATSKKSILSRSGNPDVHQKMVNGDVRNPTLESKSGTAEAATSRYYVQAYNFYKIFWKGCGNCECLGLGYFPRWVLVQV